jgi:alpha-1,2-mannosyltransferase
MTTAALKAFWLKRFAKEDVRGALDRLASIPLLRKRAVFWAAAFILSFLFILQTLSFVSEWDMDSPSYLTAARGLLLHINIYDDGEFQEVGNSLFGKGLVVYPYIYPPLLAQLCLPLKNLSQTAYFFIFYILNILMTFLAVYLISYFLELKSARTVLPTLFPFLLLLFNEPLLTTIHHGQVNLVVLNAILLSLILQKKERWLPAAFFLSLAVFIKIYPILFVLPFVFSKRLKHLAAFAATSSAVLAVSLAVSGFKPWLDFGKSTLSLFWERPDSPFTRGFQDSFGNVSLKGFLSQFFYRLGLPPGLVGPAFAILAVVLIAFVFAFRRRRMAPPDLAVQSSLLFILTVVLAPITWSHHFVVILFPAAFLFKRILEEKRYEAFIILAFLVSQVFYYLPWGAFPYNQVRLMASLGFFAMLLYFSRPQRQEGEAA